MAGLREIERSTLSVVQSLSKGRPKAISKVLVRTTQGSCISQWETSLDRLGVVEDEGTEGDLVDGAVGMAVGLKGVRNLASQDWLLGESVEVASTL